MLLYHSSAADVNSSIAAPHLITNMRLAPHSKEIKAHEWQDRRYYNNYHVSNVTTQI